MALKIVWTLKAEESLTKTINYLDEEWTINEILQLEQNLQDFLERISKYPKIYPSADKYNNVRKGLVDKNNYIIYRIDYRKVVIEIIYFRGTRQKPV